jgi:D-3-phosphoglycerate dehydrogenase / 2-oxoglutarate reductase
VSGAIRGSASPTVVIFDPVAAGTASHDLEAALLAQRGVRLIVPPDSASSLEAIVDADVVVVLGVQRLTAALVAGLERCVGILCYSIGMDKVDGPAAAAAGIPVRNVPDYCTEEVSDHALALLLAAQRRIVTFANLAAGGDWAPGKRPELGQIRRLRGQTLGIVGAGRIGRKVAAKARAFGFRTIAADPYVGSADDPDLPVVPMETLLAGSDAIVLCAALTESSRNLLGPAAFDRMRDGVIVVNVSRGGLIDEAALADALRSGRVGVAALDVRAPEPPDPALDPLAGLANLIQTPHIAASSREALGDLRRMAAERIIELLEEGGRLPVAAT